MTTGARYRATGVSASRARTIPRNSSVCLVVRLGYHETMAGLDFEAISADFVRELRGSQSQRTLSRRLGYRSNVVYQWEAGRRFPNMLQVFDMLRLLKPSGPGLGEIEHIHDLDELAEYLNTFAPNRGPTEVGRMIERSRHAVSRWFRGESQPRLPEFLEFVEETRRKSLDWLSRFVDPASLPSAAKTWDRKERVRALGSTMPMSMAVINAVDLLDYKELPKHREGWIADRLGIDVNSEKSIVEALADVGVLRWDGNRWEVDVEYIDLVTGPVEFWVEHCLREPYEERFFVAAVSDRCRERLRDATRRYWREVGEILARDEDPCQVVALTVVGTRLDRKD